MPAYMKTYTGKLLDLNNPKPEDINILDVCHQLALANRFNGATLRPYSVAQHCCLVAEVAGGWNGNGFAKLPEARFGLLHDASEAYLTDINGNLKHTDAFAHFCELEDAWSGAIVQRFGLGVNDLQPEVVAAVHDADKILLVTEKRDLTSGGLDNEPELGNYEPMRDVVDPWSWRTAESNYLNMFKKLFPGVQG